jgi:hypothetical protein
LIRSCLFFSLFLASCGYHLAEEDNVQKVASITIPYVEGDSGGQFTSELIKQLSESGVFVSSNKEGSLILKVKIVQDGSERIGWRYARDNHLGHREDRLMNVEGRKVIVAEVSLLDGITQKVLLGPTNVKSDADYDNVDYDSPRDLAFISEDGVPETTIHFSLGQLDTIEGAQDGALLYVYRKLAQRIVDGIINQRW